MHLSSQRSLDRVSLAQWDEGSKRKKAWCLSTVVGSMEQADGRRLREVLGAKPLLPDPKDNNKKKSGRNVARANLSSLLEFLYPEGAPAEPTQDDYAALARLTFLISDFTTSNSGKAKGAAAIVSPRAAQTYDTSRALTIMLFRDLSKP